MARVAFYAAYLRSQEGDDRVGEDQLALCAVGLDFRTGSDFLHEFSSEIGSETNPSLYISGIQNAWILLPSAR
jgi:hypothetical protein